MSKLLRDILQCHYMSLVHLQMFAHVFGTFSSPHLCLEGWLQGWLVSANQQMAGIGWLALQDIWEYCRTLFYQIFAKNYPFDQNNENKLNKHGLLLDPIVIGTRLCITSIRLIQVSLGVYRVLYTFFWPAEFPGYHQWQQESQ